MSEHCHKRGWWTKYSESRLIETENNILSVIKRNFKTWFVPIGSTVGNEDKIWTISLNEESPNTPLVMLHGFAAGIGFWCKNLDEIARDRPVYAIDLLGFGRSSRPDFARNCETAEQQWVTTIEEWRKQVKLDKFILLGHSFGGYLATSYTINHPDRVKHLILADPWGLSERSMNFKPSRYLRALGIVLYPLTFLNPLATVRAAGPFGPALVRKIRSDIARRYEDSFENTNVITEYIYQCNSRYPSGETAFRTFLKGFGQSKNPMMNRYDLIPEEVPITVLYGQDTWIDQSAGLALREKRENTSYVHIGLIPGASHHVYSDQPEIFNDLVTETCRISDENCDKKGMMSSVKYSQGQFDYELVKEFIRAKSQHKDVGEEEIEASIDEDSDQREITSQ